MNGLKIYPTNPYAKDPKAQTIKPPVQVSYGGRTYIEFSYGIYKRPFLRVLERLKVIAFAIFTCFIALAFKKIRKRWSEANAMGEDRFLVLTNVLFPSPPNSPRGGPNGGGDLRNTPNTQNQNVPEIKDDVSKDFLVSGEDKCETGSIPSITVEHDIHLVPSPTKKSKTLYSPKKMAQIISERFKESKKAHPFISRNELVDHSDEKEKGLGEEIPKALQETKLGTSPKKFLLPRSPVKRALRLDYNFEENKKNPPIINLFDNSNENEELFSSDFSEKAFFTSEIYPNNLKIWEFVNEGPPNFHSERATIAERQGASENENYEATPTTTKTNSSSYLGMKPESSQIINPIESSDTLKSIKDSLLKRVNNIQKKEQEKQIASIEEINKDLITFESLGLKTVSEIIGFFGENTTLITNLNLESFKGINDQDIQKISSAFPNITYLSWDDAEVTEASSTYFKNMLSLNDLNLEVDKRMNLIDNINQGSVTFESFGFKTVADIIDYFGESCIFIVNLNIENFEGVNDLDIKKISEAFPNITQLSLIGAEVTDASSAYFKNMLFLNNLELIASEITDILFLTQCVNLTILSLAECDQVKNIHELASCSQLRSIDFSFCKQFKDINFLKNFEKLETLNLAYCENIEDFGSLQYLRSLKVLDLTKCTHFKEISLLDECSLLEGLDISGCDLIDTNGIQTLVSKKIIASRFSSGGTHELNLVSDGRNFNLYF